MRQQSEQWASALVLGTFAGLWIHFPWCPLRFPVRCTECIGPLDQRLSCETPGVEMIVTFLIFETEDCSQEQRTQYREPK